MKKKIIYIVGCGRSGSTLLGFALGNAVGVLDLGEVMDFARFEGRPNGFGVDTENHRYWSKVSSDLQASLGPIEFSSLRRMQSDVDCHACFLPLLFLGVRYRQKCNLPYQAYVRALYEAIQKDEQHDVFVDSSKYPSRLLHLLRIFPDKRIHVIHLIRNPVDLAQAFARGGQSEPKSFLQTMAYFFVVNWFSILASLASLGLGKDRYLRVHYEDLVSAPENELKRIGAAFGIDTSPAANKINQGQPLKRGYVFNGNRMRMDAQIVFRKRLHKIENRKPMEFFFERLSGLMFGGAAANNAHNSNK